MLPELKTAIPGPRSLDLGERLRRHESRNITFISPRFPVFWERAAGVNVWDVDGNRYLDFTSAFGVAGLGHTRPEVSRALREQSGLLLHGMGDVHPTRLKVELCERLSELTFERWNRGEAKVILANSGFESVEAALKTALLRTGRSRVLTFEGAYHGLGYGTLAAGVIPSFREPFDAQLKPFGAVLPFPPGDPAELPAPRRGDPSGASPAAAEAINRVRAEIEKGDVGAILVEPLQGRGGKILADPAFLFALREICDATGAVLIFDEIFSGLNRTGKLFACEHFAVYPDIICLGKALTSGFPLSACVARSEIMDAWPASRGEALHTSTFLGSPLGCAMALASLEIHALPETAEAVRAAGTFLRTRLEEIGSPRVASIRGLGLMLGLELNGSRAGPDGNSAPRESGGRALAGAIVTRALQDGLMILAESPGGNVISLVPPFDISREEMIWTRDRLQEYLISLPGSVS